MYKCSIVLCYIIGYYCDNSIEAIGDLTNYTCPLGQYCPGQTEYGNQYPCPSGTFNNRSGMVNETDCQQCTPGYYCQNTGLPEPQGLCFPGYVLYYYSDRASGVCFLIFITTS